MNEILRVSDERSGQKGGKEEERKREVFWF